MSADILQFPRTFKSPGDRRIEEVAEHLEQIFENPSDERKCRLAALLEQKIARALQR